MRKLPAWATQRRPLPPGVRAALNSEVQIPLRQSAETVRGPREIDITYSYTPDPGYERDERVTAAIKRFDPNMVPLWGRYTFIVDNDTGTKEMVTFGRHVIARRISTPKNPLEPLHVVMGADYKGPVPNLIELIWDGRVFGKFDDRGKELPGEYLPWNWRLYQFAQTAWNFKQNNSVEQLKEKLVLTPQKVLAEAAAKRKAAQQEEMAKLRVDVQKILDRVSEVELEREMKYGHLREKPKKIQNSKMPSVQKGGLGTVLDKLPANAEIILSN